MILSTLNSPGNRKKWLQPRFGVSITASAAATCVHVQHFIPYIGRLRIMMVDLYLFYFHLNLISPFTDNLD